MPSSLGAVTMIKLANTWDFGVYPIFKQQRLWQACTNVQTSHSLYHSHTKYGCRWRLRLKFRPLALLDMAAWAFEGGCIYVMIPKSPELMHGAYRQGYVKFKDFSRTSKNLYYSFQGLQVYENIQNYTLTINFANDGLIEWINKYQKISIKIVVPLFGAALCCTK